jgi:hypothetical protein
VALMALDVRRSLDWPLDWSEVRAGSIADARRRLEATKREHAAAQTLHGRLRHELESAEAVLRERPTFRQLASPDFDRPAWIRRHLEARAVVALYGPAVEDARVEALNRGPGVAAREQDLDAAWRRFARLYTDLQQWGELERLRPELEALIGPLSVYERTEV